MLNIESQMQGDIQVFYLCHLVSCTIEHAVDHREFAVEKSTDTTHLGQ